MRTSDCIFCSIVTGNLPCYAVFEDDSTIAFLDQRPLFLGHTLLIPKSHIADFTALPIAEMSSFFGNAKRIAKAMEKAFLAEGTFIAMNNRVSQSVPHLHLHIVPRQFKDGLRGFFWPRQTYLDQQQKTDIQHKLREAIQQITEE